MCPRRSYFRAVPSQNGDNYVISPPPPIVELVVRLSIKALRKDFVLLSYGTYMIEDNTIQYSSTYSRNDIR